MRMSRNSACSWRKSLWCTPAGCVAKMFYKWEEPLTIAPIKVSTCFCNRTAWSPELNNIVWLCAFIPTLLPQEVKLVRFPSVFLISVSKINLCTFGMSKRNNGYKSLTDWNHGAANKHCALTIVWPDNERVKCLSLRNLPFRCSNPEQILFCRFLSASIRIKNTGLKDLLVQHGKNWLLWVCCQNEFAKHHL